MSEIKVIDGVVHIPYQSIVEYAYMIAENCDGYRTFEELEDQHQKEVNRIYGSYTDKEYEEVPQEEIDKYDAFIQELKDEWENDDYE